jgi:sugar-specific transcriptional regulator TrmB
MPQTKALKNLGLTKQEADIYLLILEKGFLKAKDLSGLLHILPNAVYRNITRLEEKGLLLISSHAPLRYRPHPVEFALNRLVRSREKALEKSAQALLHIKGKPPTLRSETAIALSADKLRFFAEATAMIRKARKEVLIISIGEPSPPELILADTEAIKRGVTIKMIVHKYDPDNFTLLQNLKRNGLEVKHLQDWGYHLQITDGNKYLLAVNNPKNTEERANIMIQSSYLSRAFRDYFFLLWEKATPV